MTLKKFGLHEQCYPCPTLGDHANELAAKVVVELRRIALAHDDMSLVFADRWQFAPQLSFSRI